jgi:osmotically-inducible protein OsmY
MKKVILLSVFIVFGVVLFEGLSIANGETAGQYHDSAITKQVKGIIIEDPDTQYLKIDVKTSEGEVVLQGFVNDRETEERLVVKIKQIRGVRSVKSLLKLE